MDKMIHIITRESGMFDDKKKTEWIGWAGFIIFLFGAALLGKRPPLLYVPLANSIKF